MNLKPCPFCENKDIRMHSHRTDDYRAPKGLVWSMCCYGCGATFPNRFKKELLVDAWNTRATPAGTVITEDESTWPEDGQEIVYRVDGALTSGVFLTHFLDIWLGCIWWPADQYNVEDEK